MQIMLWAPANVLPNNKQQECTSEALSIIAWSISYTTRYWDALNENDTYRGRVAPGPWRVRAGSRSASPGWRPCPSRRRPTDSSVCVSAQRGLRQRRRPCLVAASWSTLHTEKKIKLPSCADCSSRTDFEFKHIAILDEFNFFHAGKDSTENASDYAFVMGNCDWLISWCTQKQIQPNEQLGQWSGS